MRNIKSLPDIINFCATIGNLPTSYMQSLTYEEQLLWLLNFLNKTILPTMHETINSVEELENWFNNLDVQEQINNKLDAMVEDGTMAEIINQEIFSDLNTAIQTVSTNVTNLTSVVNRNESKPTIFIGDSYGNDEDEWADIVSGLILDSEENITSSDLYNWCVGGASAVAISGAGNKTYLQIMQENASQVDDPNKIRRIVLVGGYNDRYQNRATNYGALHTLFNYCRTTYPNAKVYFGCVGWDSNVDHNSIRHTILTEVLPAYKDTNKFGGIYLSGIEYSLHYYKDIWKTDGYHPNTEGEKIIGYNVFNLLNNNNFAFESGINNQAMTTTIFASAIGYFVYSITDKLLRVLLNNVILGTPSSTITLTSGGTTQDIDLGIPTNLCDVMRRANTLSTIPVTVSLIDSSSNRYQFNGELFIGNDGHYHLILYKNLSTDITVSNIILDTNIVIDRLYL